MAFRAKKRLRAPPAPPAFQLHRGRSAGFQRSLSFRQRGKLKTNQQQDKKKKKCPEALSQLLLPDSQLLVHRWGRFSTGALWPGGCGRMMALPSSFLLPWLHITPEEAQVGRADS